MNLSLFFSPVEESLSGMKAEDNSVVDNLSFFGTTSDSWRVFDVAIIGINEFRGLSSDVADNSKSTYVVREKLYRLRSQFDGLRVIDLGDLRLGESLSDTQDRLREVLLYLLESKVIPIVIGGGQDLANAQYRAYENVKSWINWANIDSKIDVDGCFPAHDVVRSVLEYQPTFLYNYIHLGHQAYLVNPDITKLFEKLHFDGLRLGELKATISESEPMLRGADMVTFDINCVEPGSLLQSEAEIPFGLSPQEACQLAWYAGLGDRVTSFGLYNYQIEKDTKKLGAALLATMIWYFIEGVKLREKEIDFTQDHYTKYVVPITDMEGTIVFYKNNNSGKWWMEIKKDDVLPCSYADYELANKGEIPDRWLKASNRL